VAFVLQGSSYSNELSLELRFRQSGACHGYRHSMIGHFPCRRGCSRSEPDVTWEALREITGAGEIDERLRCISAFMVQRQERGVCTILNTYARISEECPMAIHSVELCG
jgi:hypothetical protein